jgi:Uma2 family endonuclease
MIQRISPPSAPPAPRQWTIDEYYRLGELGFFNDQRVELIESEIIDMAPQGSEHFASVCLVGEVLRRAFGDGHVVRIQGPLRIADSTEPEPDIAVVPGTPRDYVGKDHPNNALLVVEVSDTSLVFDRTDKASLYASAGIADYWIVNLIDRQLEVFRLPTADASARFGWTYAERTILKSADQIKPLSAQSSARIADMLP